jgi:protein O-mannosyl-transferase
MKKPSNTGLSMLVIFLFAIAIYSVSVFNDYALDDLMVINGNSFTEKGIDGIREIFTYDSFTGFWGKEKNLVAGGRYRPFSIATFAVEKSLTGSFNPMISHLINILLYALTGMLIFIIFSKLIKTPDRRQWYLSVPFLAAMLFIAHPVHTEVVANIKGRDEIFALLFSLITVWLTILYVEKRRIFLLILANLSFFLGLLSKENAIVFVAIVPLTLWFFMKVPIKKNILMALPLLITAMIFVFIRFLVLGQIVSTVIPKELLNNPFLEATTGQRYGTIIYTLGLYIKLLFFPHPLTHDYYPYQIPLVSLDDMRAIVPLIIYVALILYAAWMFRQKSLASYCILFYMITLLIVSNLLFPVGTFMNERFIYMPSLAFAVIAAYLIVEKLPGLFKNSPFSGRLVLTIMVSVLLLFSVKTFTRSQVWKNSFTLFSTDVLVSENSIKCNISAGGDYMQKAIAETDSVQKENDFKHSLQYLEKAIRLAPASINALVLYGNINALYLKNYKTAVDQYLKALRIDPGDKPSFDNAVRIIESVDNESEYVYKINTYLFLRKLDPGNSSINYNLGRMYGKYAGNLDSAGFYLEEAIRLSPKEIQSYKDLGIIYSMKKNFVKAIECLKTASKLDPNDLQVKQNLELTYRIMQHEKK